MKPREIRDNVYLLGHVDWDRRLFDALIPLPRARATTPTCAEAARRPRCSTRSTRPCGRRSPRPAHRLGPTSTTSSTTTPSRTTRAACASCSTRYPDGDASLTNERCKAMLIDHLHIPEDRIRVVADGETVSLGDKTLRFVYTPWVHWPETMSTYLEEDKILFSCDFFGSHLATTDLYAASCRRARSRQALLRRDHDALRTAGGQGPRQGRRARHRADRAESRSALGQAPPDRRRLPGVDHGRARATSSVFRS